MTATEPSPDALLPVLAEVNAVERRFWAKVDKTEGCWLWTAYVNRDGYGRVSFNQTMRLAHRVAYELLVGPIPSGLELDHLCRVPACVNPAHLEPVTHQENIRRGTAGQRCKERAAAVTHCPQGHPYDEENTFIRRDGRRRCKACSAAKSRLKRQRAKETRT